jgi:hypothetical protein
MLGEDIVLHQSVVADWWHLGRRFSAAFVWL